MKCTVCREPAVIDLRRHNANFCAPHLRKFCRDQVARAIHDFDMFGPADRILVAVSGGKDSLALWDLLSELGYQADGLYIGLGFCRLVERATVAREPNAHSADASPVTNPSANADVIHIAKVVSSDATHTATHTAHGSVAAAEGNP